MADEMIVLDTPAKIDGALFRIRMGGLGCEVKGMTRRGRSMYSIVKEAYGYKGNKASVYAQMKADWEAAFPA